MRCAYLHERRSKIGTSGATALARQTAEESIMRFKLNLPAEGGDKHLVSTATAGISTENISKWHIEVMCQKH